MMYDIHEVRKIIIVDMRLKMLKQDFLDGLRRSLSGKVDVELIDETIRYYEDYIDVQIKKGESESSVLEKLGKPALLAKSIVQANANCGNSGSQSEIYEDGEAERYSRSKVGDKGVRLITKMPGWLAVFLALLILFLILSFVFSVLSFLAPVLIPLGIIFVIIAIRKSKYKH